MRSVLQHLATLTLLASGLSACSGEREPRDYDECILKYVKAGMDRAAVLALQRSCRAKFPTDTSGADGSTSDARGRELTFAELAALDGRGGPSGNYFSGNLYNGHANLAITSVRIRVATRIGGKDVSRVYEEKVSIAPRTTGSFFFSIIVGDEGANYDWSIEGATGIPSK